MYRRLSNNNNQNILNPNNEIREEIKAEDAIAAIGNEALNRMGGLANPDSNEANNEILGNVSPDGDRLGHYMDNDLNALFKSKKNKKRGRKKEAGTDLINNIIEKGMTEKEIPGQAGKEDLLNIIDTSNEQMSR